MCQTVGKGGQSGHLTQGHLGSRRNVAQKMWPRHIQTRSELSRLIVKRALMTEFDT